MLFKRFFDISFSLVSLLLLLPLTLIIALIIYFKLGWPIFFTQDRVGKGGKIFKMIKFRSMLNSKDKDGNLLSDEERLTTFGKALRSTSLDELPELINVLKGDMSLIGPRPLLIEYLPLYSGEQMKRHDVLPGITGWAQINGRNSIQWNQKLELDVWYVEHWSLILDVQIFFKTIVKLFKRDGINQEGNVTVERFNGYN
jgi:Sugar transferases involved in lipopolysaccharide synthesis